MATIAKGTFRDNLMTSSNSYNNDRSKNSSEYFLNIGLRYIKEDGSEGFAPIPGIVLAIDKIQELSSKNPELKDLALAIRLIKMNMDKLEPGETALVHKSLTSKLDFQVRRISDEPASSTLITDEDDDLLASLL
jgi:hypothetical protein